MLTQTHWVKRALENKTILPNSFMQLQPRYLRQIMKSAVTSQRVEETKSSPRVQTTEITTRLINTTPVTTSSKGPTPHNMEMIWMMRKRSLKMNECPKNIIHLSTHQTTPQLHNHKCHALSHWTHWHNSKPTEVSIKNSHCNVFVTFRSCNGGRHWGDIGI